MSTSHVLDNLHKIAPKVDWHMTELLAVRINLAWEILHVASASTLGPQNSMAEVT